MLGKKSLFLIVCISWRLTSQRHSRTWSRVQIYVSVPRSLRFCFLEIVLDRDPLAALSRGYHLRKALSAIALYFCSWDKVCMAFVLFVLCVGRGFVTLGCIARLGGQRRFGVGLYWAVAWPYRQAVPGLSAEPPRMTSVFFLCILRHPSPAFEFDRCPKDKKVVESAVIVLV